MDLKIALHVDGSEHRVHGRYAHDIVGCVA